MALPTVGFIGLGIMGRPMARHVLHAGYPLIVHSRSRPPIDALVELGAQEASTPAQLAQRCEVVITCLPDDETVRRVWLTGDAPALTAMRPETIAIDMGTTSPSLTRALAEYAHSRGVAFLDAPVTGGQWGAEAGTLTIMVGGDPNAYERALPIFQTMGKKVVYVGESGKGQLMKLANQIAVAIGTLAVAESLLFAEHAGLDLNLTVETLSAGAAGSWAMEHLGKRIVQGDFQPGFMVQLLQKDLHILLNEARQTATPLLGSALVQQLYAHLERTGEDRLGTQALMQVLRRLSGDEAGV
ncbi:MAG: tartronate semialdehyde reductase [Fimbriimonadales bacterium]|nr:MAG: tartronate semialdehyde reductase [Fimbriimonadales bacterium]